MDYRVTVQVDGSDIPCGRIFQSVRRGVETVSFSYDSAYLAHPQAFPLSPDMPLTAGIFASAGFQSLRAFEDAMPDRWGRNLLKRSERFLARSEKRTERTLFESDYLAGASDETRQGAIRVWNAGGKTALASSETGVPREISIPQLLDAADAMVKDLDADVKDLIAAGSSLGGARPKASVRMRDGGLCIAKFPKTDESDMEDVGAWERVCAILMERNGIDVPVSKTVRIQGRSVFLSRRFDRVQAGNMQMRVPYISGLSAVQGKDGGLYSYLELAEFIEDEGANPDQDLPELWKRALFSCAVGNTDNHLRNYGFLRRADGWALAPAFDVNPTAGDAEKHLATALDFDKREADPRIALDVADYFRVGASQARSYARHMARIIRGWSAVARSEGIAEASIRHMESCFQRGIHALEGL